MQDSNLLKTAFKTIMQIRYPMTVMNAICQYIYIAYWSCALMI